jgi:hypothetical protein
MRHLLLRNHLAPGDVLMLTAAVRDLHRGHPDEFLTDVRTSAHALWDNNPYLTPLEEHDPSVEVIECHYPLIRRSNQAPYHFIHGFIHFLNERLALNIQPTSFKGDIHLSERDRSGPVFGEEALLLNQHLPWPFGEAVPVSPEVSAPLGERETEGGAEEGLPLWLVSAGGKQDFTIKWWDTRRYQAVLDHFQGRVQFVQVGSQGHFHPELEGVIDLRGRTDLRQLIQRRVRP